MAEAQKYRKKPVVIEAMHFSNEITPSAAMEIIHWMGQNLYPFLRGDATKPETLRYPDQVEGDDSRPDKGCYINPETGMLVIRTLEGDMHVSPGDYVVKGTQGEFYPVKPDIFENIHEKVV